MKDWEMMQLMSHIQLNLIYKLNIKYEELFIRIIIIKMN